MRRCWRRLRCCGRGGVRIGKLAEGEVVFDHPQYDGAAYAAVRSLERIQGRHGIWFAGAWLGSGFHEDGLKSGLRAALSLGGQVEWDPVGVETVYLPDRHAPTQADRRLSVVK